MRMVLWGALVGVVSVLAFLVLDPILAAFLVILLVTGAVIAVLARDWDQHSTYEEREAARARKRAEKWDRNQAARDRDRARWEAHQAKRGSPGPTATEGYLGRPPPDDALPVRAWACAPSESNRRGTRLERSDADAAGKGPVRRLAASLRVV